MDAVAAVAAAAAASGVDCTAGDGDAAAAEDAAAAAATLGRQAVIFVTGDGEAAVAGDAAAAGAVTAAVTTGEMVVALQGQRHVAVRSEGGTGVGADIDVHILERDLDLIVLIVGLDGHGVGRSGVLITICDDSVGVFHLLIRPL